MPAALPAASPAPRADALRLPRTVIGLYDGVMEPRMFARPVHRQAAMPIEWLGMTMAYHDVRHGLPPAWEDPDCRGAVTWFPEPSLPDYEAFVAWVERFVASGRRLVIVGDAAPRRGLLPGAQVEALRRRLYAALGLRWEGGWSPVTLGDRVRHAEPGRIGFELPLPDPLPPYEIFEPARPDMRSWLVVERDDTPRRVSHLVVTGPPGGFIAPGYAIGVDERTGVRPWHVDPFAFFESAFDAADLPRPDTTTLCGRRIYYSHIDGDGWLSISRVRGRDGARATTAEVVLREVIAPNPDLPVTVAPIAAEIDPARLGDARALAVAREIFALPQVEPASHTDSHPFDWGFFEDYTPEREQPFQALYARLARGEISLGLRDPDEAALGQAGCPGCAGRQPGAAGPGGEAGGTGLSPNYLVPRAYGARPFSLVEEKAGAAALIDRLAPPGGRRVTLLQWSGNCAPFAEAIREARRAGLANINGGDTRCDDEYPSVASVAPIGLRLAPDAIQIYASNSNENTYTEDWSNRFFAFRDLPVTWDRTERPRRLKPMNLYYHMYSGERLASLEALRANIRALRRREFIAVFATRFVAMAEGFFSTVLVQEGPEAWRVLGRGRLATLRFPRGAERMLDPVASEGVLGERVVQGELYVALDPAAPAPRVALAPRRNGLPARPLLVQSAWEVSRLRLLPGAADGFAFSAEGLGPGRMEWRVSRPGAWTFRAPGWSDRVTAGSDGMLALSLPAAVSGLPVEIRPA